MTTNAWNDRLDIQAAGSELEQVNDFCYLGSYISQNGSCEKDQPSISLKVKTRLYKAIILSTLLYTAELWPLSATLTKKLAAHHRWQRSLLGISWKDKVANAEVRTRTGQKAWRTYTQRKKTALAGSRFADGPPTDTTTGTILGGCRFQERTRSTKG